MDKQEAIEGGYLAASVGGIIGGLLLGSGGWLWASTIEGDPHAGMANLGLMLLGLAVISASAVVGLAAGTGVALAATGQRGVWATSALAACLAAVAAITGIALVLAPAMPAAARWLVITASRRRIAEGERA